MTGLLGHLRGLGVVREVAPSSNPMELLLEEYRHALVDGRGLAGSTAGRYVNSARMFLVEAAGGDGLDLASLSAGAVSGFVVRQGRRLSVGSTKDLVTCLRSFLRFLESQELIEGHLVSAVPAVASWRGASLPKALSAEQVAALLASCDPTSVVGRRDLAMLTLLARLGLRAREVASLQLDDVDWRRGEIVVRGKGGRCDRLPVPVDVGEAVVGYLCHGRPPVRSRAMFLRAFAPIRGLSPVSVSSAVGRACVRAGLPVVGAHRLRHSAATAMLQAGSSLSEVGQVLRHNQLATTAIYAKVDRGALVGLARQWPGGAA
ncbi:MAG: site-specific integrase [Candidatus Dormiibacterota bacterium]